MNNTNRGRYDTLNGKAVRCNADLEELFQDTHFTPRGLRYDPRMKSKPRKGFLKNALVLGGALVLLGGLGYLVDKGLERNARYEQTLQEEMDDYQNDVQTMNDFYKKHPGAEASGRLPSGKEVSYNRE